MQRLVYPGFGFINKLNISDSFAAAAESPVRHFANGGDAIKPMAKTVWENKGVIPINFRCQKLPNLTKN